MINIDDPHGRRLRELTPLPVTTFSTDGNPADWRAVNIRPHRLGTDLEVLGPDELAIDLTVPLPGVFNVSNALSVIAALAQAGYDPKELAEGIATSTGVPGRMPPRRRCRASSTWSGSPGGWPRVRASTSS